MIPPAHDRHHTRRLTWRLEPARERTVLICKGVPVRLAFPPVAHAILETRVAPNGDFNFGSLSTFTYKGEFRHDTHLTCLGTNVTGHFGSCLGYRATKAVCDGRLDPVEAFWNTDFHHAIYDTNNGIDRVWYPVLDTPGSTVPVDNCPAIVAWYLGVEVLTQE